MRGQRKNPRKAVQPFENKKRKIDIFKNYEANGVEKIQRKLEIFSTLISKKSRFSKELVYKKDPNSIRRYALWHLKNKDFGRFTKLLLIYLSVLIERKKRKLSKKLAH